MTSIFGNSLIISDIKIHIVIVIFIAKNILFLIANKNKKGQEKCFS